MLKKTENLIRPLYIRCRSYENEVHKSFLKKKCCIGNMYCIGSNTLLLVLLKLITIQLINLLCFI
jgi:hypothetical protein